MSHETKWDVFNKLLAAYLKDEKRLDKLVNEPDEHIPELDVMYFNKSYDAALPDDLPIIPKDVSEELRAEYGKYSLLDELIWASQDALPSSKVSEWIDSNEAIFAEAWSRGLWIVKETGKVTGYDEK